MTTIVQEMPDEGADFDPNFEHLRKFIDSRPDMPDFEYDEEFWEAVEDGSLDLYADDEEEAEPETKGLDSFAEMKARVIRRVRNAEGARRYGQPIGTIIRRDKDDTSDRRPAATQKPASKKPASKKPKALKPQKLYAGNATREDMKEWEGKYVTVGFRFGEPQEGVLKLYDVGDRIALTGVDGRAINVGLDRINTIAEKEAPPAPKPIKVPKGWDNDSDSFQKRWRRKLADGSVAIVYERFTSREGEPNWEWQITTPGQSAVTRATPDTSGRVETPEEAFKAATAAIKKREKAMGNRAKAVEREAISGGFRDNWYGVRGWDWEEVEGEGSIDWDDRRARLRLAQQEMEDLGVQIKGTGAGVDYIENALAAFRTYEAMFPGITYYQRALSFQSKSKMTFRTPRGTVHAAAYNTVRNDWNDMQHNFQRDDDNESLYGPRGTTGDAGGWNEIGLAFSLGHYGDDDATTTKLTEYAKQTERSGFASTRITNAAETLGLEVWQAEFLNTFNHEVGHTFGRVAFGHFTGSKEGPEQRVDRRDRFFAGLRDIFQKYDMQFAASDADAFVGSSDEYMDRNVIVGTNKGEVTGVLSSYGSTNLHELIAEAWAEYMMDAEPRAFARDIGDMLWDMMDEFLDNEGAR